MDTSVNKYSAYKTVPSIERKSLTQGIRRSSPGHSQQSATVQSSRSLFADSHTLQGSHGNQTTSYSPILERDSVASSNRDAADFFSSPRRPLQPHSTVYPTSDLSLSDSDSPPSSTQVHGHQTHQTPRHIPAAIEPHSSKSVIVINADEASLSDSVEVKTTSMKSVSPVKVTRHYYNENNEEFNTALSSQSDTTSTEPGSSLDWRRFSSNFVCPPFSLQGRIQLADHSLQRTTDTEHLDQLGKRTTADSSNQVQVQAVYQSHERHLNPDRSGDKSLDPSTTCNLSTIEEDSFDLSELSDLADTTHRRDEGVGRSTSDQTLTRERPIHEPASAHSVSAVAGTTTRKQTKKGRQVPSRYMSGALSGRKPSSRPRVIPPLSGPAGKITPAAPHKTSAVKNKSVGKVPPIKSLDKRVQKSTARPSLNAQRQLSTPSHLPPTALSMSFTPSRMVTSTPAYTHASSLDGSYLASDSAMPGDLSHLSMSVASSKKLTYGKSKGSEVSEMELELLNSRLLQSTMLNIMSACGLREQEKMAKTQLYTLWKAVEDKKYDELLLKKIIEIESRTLTLERSLDVQLQALEPVCVELVQLEQQHTSLAQALDSTRHNLTLRGVQPLHEGQLQEQLAESEQVFCDIMTAIRSKVQKVSSFSELTNAVVNTLRNEYEELERCWSSLEKLTKVQLYSTSLCLEHRQRTT